MSAVVKPHRRIGDILLEMGVVTPDQLRIALIEQKTRSEPLGKIIISLGFATEAVMREALGEALGADSVDLTRVVADMESLQSTLR